MENIDLVQIITGVVSIASAVAAITKTPGKRSKVNKIYRLIDLLALNIGRAKDRPE